MTSVVTNSKLMRLQHRETSVTACKRRADRALQANYLQTKLTVFKVSVVVRAMLGQHGPGAPGGLKDVFDIIETMYVE